jgi:DNA polymerase-3 subunit alpha
LGIRALTVLADAVTAVRQHSPDFKLDNIPVDDPATADMLAHGNTIGVFQCESEGARRTLLKLRAKSVRDLAVANAFFKPGPATGGMADAFVQRYRGQASVTYLHPSLAAILGKTQGILLFQEQILRVATEVAGLSWQQAGFLRRGMSKMQPQEMTQMQKQFVTGCQRPPPEGPGLSPRQAQQLWEQVAAFSGYGFNQGHATAYANISYRSAYLKAHWPAAFFYGRLQNWGGFHHPAVYMAEAMRLGISVRLPHVNHSERNFGLTFEGEQPVLWMGLGQVRDVRDAILHELIIARKRMPFRDLRDVLARIPLRDKEIKHLIQCGALDNMGENRMTMLHHAERISRSGNARQLAFDFTNHVYTTHTLRQQLEWENNACGYPFTALTAIFEALHRAGNEGEPTVRLEQLRQQPGKHLRSFAVRLPGRSGGGSIYLWDGSTWVLAKLNKPLKNPAAWAPIKVMGHWSRDNWGMEWLQVEAIQALTRTVELESPATV